jgi:hypothetical protein
MAKPTVVLTRPYRTLAAGLPWHTQRDNSPAPPAGLEGVAEQGLKMTQG